MKHFTIPAFLFIFISCHSVVYSQKVTLGFYSGMNFSDIHGQDFGGKWSSKPGPSQGIILGYSFNKLLGVQTGIGFASVYYEHKNFAYPYQYYPVQPFYYIDITTVSGINEMMNFNFLRVPVLFTVSIPAVIKFNMRAGLFLSCLKDYSLSTYYYNPDKPKKYDLGYLVSSGISYPLSDNLNATLNVNYITGREKFLNDHRYRHGSSEFTLGMEYRFFKKNQIRTDPMPHQDSTVKKVTVSYRGGLNVSWNPRPVDGKKYLPSFGPSLGFSLNFPIGKEIFLISGVSFERKGYSIKDSSDSFFSYIRNQNQMYYVNTKVQADYAVIPALIRFPLGKSKRIFFSSGPWFGLKLNARNVGVAYKESRSGSNYSYNKYTVYDDFERLIKNDDIGWLLSSGVSLPFSTKYKIDLALQFTTGFKDVYNKSVLADQQTTSTENPVIRNRAVSFLIAFTIPHANH
jgi:hypothetical protein